MKNIFLRATVLLMAAVLILSMVSCSTDKQGLTKEYFEQNKTEVLSNSVDYTEVFGNFENPFEIFTKDIASLDVIFNEKETGTSLEFGIDTDVKNFKNNVFFQMAMPGNLNVDLSVYFDKDKFALSSDTLLGEDASYGIKFDKFENIIAKLDKSDLAKMLGLAEGDAALVCEAYGINQEYIDGIAKAYKDYEDKTKKYNDVNAIINDLYALYESHYGEVTEETVDVDGKKIDTLALEMNFDKEVVQIAYDWYMGLYKESIENTKALTEALIPVPFKEEMIPEISMYYDTTFETMQQEFAYMMENIDLSGSMKVYVDRVTGKYLMEKGELDITVDGEKIHLAVEEYLVDNGIAFDIIATEADGEHVALSGFMGLEKTEDGEKWVITVTPDDNQENTGAVNMGFEINKADGRYILECVLLDGEETANMSASGDLIFTKDTFEMSVDSITSYDETTKLDLRVKASTNADVVEPENFKDILEMTQDEIVAVAYRFIIAAEAFQ